MSVLLDALKKAAEEKKSSNSEKSSDEIKLDQNLIVDESEINPETTAKDDAEVVVESSNASESLPNFEFKLSDTDHNISEQKEVFDPDLIDNSISSTASQAENNDISNDGIENESFEDVALSNNNDHVDLMSDNESNQIESFNIEAETQVDSGLEKLDENPSLDIVNSQVETNSAEVDLASSDQDSDNSFNELDSLIDTLGIDETVAPPLKLAGEENTQAKPTSKLSLGSEPTLPTSKASLGLNEAELGDLQDNGPNDNKDFGLDSFDWSLDNLPGYTDNQTGSTPKKAASSPELNPILVSGSNTPPKPKPKKVASSSGVFLSLFVFLLFVVIGFYGIVYYQEQNEQLEKSMRKYNIAALDIKPKTQPNAINYQSENQATKGQDDVVVVVPKKLEKIDDSTVSQDDVGEANNQPNDDNASSVNPQASQSVTQAVVKTVPKNKPSSVSPSKSTQVRYKGNEAIKAKPASSRKVTQDKKIVKVEINKTKSLVAEAYDSYNSGNYAKAANLFKQLLAKDPKNTKALLGLGGIAVINGNYVSAVNYYDQILKNTPNNLFALEAIANLSGKVPLNAEWDKQLFKMAEIYPNSAVLQNACGNSYAKRNNWIAAQQNYFNAIVAKPNNPDYMLNLAVSYDHLGKYELASQYYTKALAFVGKSKVGFNPQSVKARLISIRQLMIKG